MSDTPDTRHILRDAARRKYRRYDPDGNSIEVDDIPRISLVDEGGAWVAAWLWLDPDETEGICPGREE